MPEPRKDTRKRDRAAYMRDYRAGRKKVIPTIEALTQRVAVLEEAMRVMTMLADREIAAHPYLREAVPGFGSPRPAPKTHTGHRDGNPGTKGK